MTTKKRTTKQSILSANIEKDIKNLGDSPMASKIDAIVDSIAKLEDPIDRQLKVGLLQRKSKLKEGFIQEMIGHRAGKVEAVKYTDEQKAQARELLNDPHLIDRYLDACHLIYVGRDVELLLVKLATISRHCEESFSVVLTGESAVGKNNLINAAMKTCDPSTCEKFSRISAQYLLYRIKPLCKKILIFEELNGATGAMQILRTAMSEDHLSLGTVSDNASDGLTPEERRKSTHGLVIISAWTGYQPEHETSTRLLMCELQHSDTLTREIFRAKGDAAANVSVQLATSDSSMSFKEEFSVWQCADSLIEAKPVVIPYAPAIAAAFPTNSTRYHRDLPRALAIIRSSALWHQHQRERTEEGVIIATEADYDVLLRLSSIFEQSSLSIPAPVIAFLNLIQQHPGIDRGALEPLSGVHVRTIQRYVNLAVEGEYLEVKGRGAKQTYRILDIPDTDKVLPQKRCIFPILPIVGLSDSNNSIDRLRDISDKGVVGSDKSDTGEDDASCLTFEEIIAGEVDALTKSDMSGGNMEESNIDGKLREKVTMRLPCTWGKVSTRLPSKDDDLEVPTRKAKLCES